MTKDWYLSYAIFFGLFLANWLWDAGLMADIALLAMASFLLGQTFGLRSKGGRS